MWARSKGRCRWRLAASWWTQVSREFTTVASSGTLMSSDVSSFAISSMGSSRNSWPPTTSKKCSCQSREQVAQTAKEANYFQISENGWIMNCKTKGEGKTQEDFSWGQQEINGWRRRREGNEGLRKVRGKMDKKSWKKTIAVSYYCIVNSFVTPEIHRSKPMSLQIIVYSQFAQNLYIFRRITTYLLPIKVVQ